MLIISCHRATDWRLLPWWVVVDFLAYELGGNVSSLGKTA
jgi:hypothetical protein